MSSEIIDELRIEIVKKSRPYKNIFSGEDGKKVMQDLKQEFTSHDRLAISDPNETLIRSAQYDVIDYIEKMIRVKESKDEI